MDFTGILFGFLVIIVVVLFLGALNYFLSRPQSNMSVSEKKSTSNLINQTHSQTSTSRTNACSMRRKQARLAKKNQRLQQANTTNENLNSKNNDKQEIQTTIPKRDSEEEEEEQSSVQPTDDDNEEFYDAMKNNDVTNDSPSTSIPPDEEPLVPVKQRKKSKVNSKPSIESTLPKPQASVVPVKQTQTSIPSPNIPIDQNSKLNGRLPSSYNLYSYPAHKSLPPRFQQRQHRDLNSTEKLRQRKPTTPVRKSTIQPEAAARQNDFIPLAIRQQPSNKTNHLESSHQNGYSSESDNLSGKTSSSSSVTSPIRFFRRNTINRTH